MTNDRRHCSSLVVGRWSFVTQRQRADASTADRVAVGVQPLAPGQRLRRVQDRVEAAGLVDVAERRLKEAWPHRTVGFYNARNPGRVTRIREEITLAEQRGVVLAQPAAEFERRLGDVAAREIGREF